MSGYDNVYVITPTIGCGNLTRCVNSVLEQTFHQVIHIVVVDGACYEKTVREKIDTISDDRLKVITLPFNTGGRGMLGGIIYDSICRIIDDGYVVFLDDDNVFLPGHLASCISLVKTHNLDWCYSLRRLVDEMGKYICNDDCNSLGIWPSYDGVYHHIDTNCYFLSVKIAHKYISQIRRPAYQLGQQEGDRAFAQALIADGNNFFCTGLYTVDYLIKGHSGYSFEEVKDYYMKGNRIMEGMYVTFPWSSLVCEGAMKEHPAMGLKGH